MYYDDKIGVVNFIFCFWKWINLEFFVGKNGLIVY